MDKQTDRRTYAPDRRRNRFGRRGPGLLLFIGNLLIRNTTVFCLYMFISVLALLYTIANLAYDLNHLVIGFLKGLVE